jgi:MFS family permease
MLGLTTQANIVLGVYVLQLIALSIFILYIPAKWDVKLNLFLVVTALMLISGFLTVYGVNCMIVGDCNAYAWVITGLILVGFVVSLVDVFMTSSRLRENFVQGQQRVAQKKVEKKESKSKSALKKQQNKLVRA